MATDKVDFLKKIKSLLVYHEAIGIRHYPRTEEVESFCEIQVTSPSSSSKNKNSQSFPTKGKIVKAKEETTKQDREVILTDINIEIAACGACELHKHRIYPVSGRGGAGARLLIVGDWLSGDDDGNLARDRILGGDQDRMLARMFAAIKLLQDEVFITNVIKCAVPGSCYPAADHVRCCMSFLRRQIAVLVPEVICVMGMVAAKAVLDRSQSLSQLRGTFHTYKAEDGLHIPVLATYHPTYLLQNPEMKKATWADLQLLAKKLRLSIS